MPEVPSHPRTRGDELLYPSLGWRIVPEACPYCLMTFTQHVVVKARCTKRWRGANFDAAAAEGAVGAAVATVLGAHVRTTKDLEAFLKRAFVRAYGQRLDPNPEQSFDLDQGEDFEFHVGLREHVDDATLKRLEQAARDAVASSRKFALR